MSLQACPKCGYALSVSEHQCRHCSGLSRGVSALTKRDTLMVYAAITAAVAVSFSLYWMFVR